MTLPHRARLVELLAEHTRPLHVSEIAGRLGLEGNVLAGLTAMLDDMVLTGEVRAFPGARYRLAGGGMAPAKGPNLREREGYFTMNPRGFGFVSGQASGEPDAFIPPDALGGALHGDQVVVRIHRTTSRGPEGEIVRIVRRGVTRIPGTLRKRGRAVWLEPDDARMRGPITLPSASAPNPQGEVVEGNEGEAVVARITRYPVENGEHPEGELLVILGASGDPRVEVAKILAREDVQETFPDAAVAEARTYGDAITEAQIEGREDLRPLPLCTIDPRDARDHDDAVFVRRAGPHDGEDAAYVAWIAIADVSAYVLPGTALDTEAKRRGCSIYLPDRAIPMLPRELSTHLCSLVPNVDRLCLAAEVTLDPTGVPIRHRLVEGVMRSRAKIAYEDVGRALGFLDDEPLSQEAATAIAPLLDDIKVAWELSSLLKQRRMRRGALDFDIPEAKVIIDAKGECTAVVRSKGNPGVKKAYSLIEELMLLANEVVATDLTGRTVPTVYRVHGTPSEERLDQFSTLAQTLGLGFKIEDAKDPKALGKFLKLVATHPQAGVLNTLLLRAMKQATYDVVNIGHFGLASEAYLHFTSPIRRYPDLVVHRAVHRLCQGESIPRDERAMEELKQSAFLASVAERKAMNVEREVVDLHRALLMRQHLGEVFEGVVTSLVGSGVYVALDDPFVDVLVRYESLGNDSFTLDDEQLMAVGRKSGETIRMGDRMVIRVEDVSIERRAILASRLASATVEEDAPRARKGGEQRVTRRGADARPSRPGRDGRSTDRGREPRAGDRGREPRAADRGREPRAVDRGREQRPVRPVGDRRPALGAGGIKVDTDAIERAIDLAMEEAEERSVLATEERRPIRTGSRDPDGRKARAAKERKGTDRDARGRGEATTASAPPKRTKKGAAKGSSKRTAAAGGAKPGARKAATTKAKPPPRKGKKKR